MQVIAKAEDIEKFARQLKKFNSELESSVGNLSAQLSSLGSTWRDQHYQKFVSELFQLINSIKKYNKEAEAFSSYLVRKAKPLREFESI